jgi:hypothetical protein
LSYEGKYQLGRNTLLSDVLFRIPRYWRVIMMFQPVMQYVSDWSRRAWQQWSDRELPPYARTVATGCVITAVIVHRMWKRRSAQNKIRAEQERCRSKFRRLEEQLQADAVRTI